jgi:hypothetical protein
MHHITYKHTLRVRYGLQPSYSSIYASIYPCCQLPAISKDFRSALKKRLLHLGASTTQILDMYLSSNHEVIRLLPLNDLNLRYVNMVRALRLLDPSDLFLDFVTKPVRKYLLKRKDTVKRIVFSLIDSKVVTTIALYSY